MPDLVKVEYQQTGQSIFVNELGMFGYEYEEL